MLWPGQACAVHGACLLLAADDSKEVPSLKGQHHSMGLSRVLKQGEPLGLLIANSSRCKTPLARPLRVVLAVVVQPTLSAQRRCIGQGKGVMPSIGPSQLHHPY